MAIVSTPPTEGARRAEVQPLYSDRTYDIEFRGYLSNHSKHGVVALSGLGAPMTRVREWWDDHTSMTEYGWCLEPAVPARKVYEGDKAWQQDMGKKVDYGALCDFFEKRVDQLGSSGAVQCYAPTLVPGLLGALAHAIIHLGWALDAGNDWFLVEGLAYCAYAYIDIHPERFIAGVHSEATPLQSTLRIADLWSQSQLSDWVTTVKAMDKYNEESGFHSELIPAGFQWHVAKVAEEGHPVFYELPSWLDDMDVPTMLEHLYKAVTSMYLGDAGHAADPSSATANSGNFLLLHLITSLWGLEQVVSHLTDEPSQRQAFKCYWVAVQVLSFTSARGYPSRAVMEQTASRLQDAHDGTSSEVRAGQPWDEIVPRAIAEVEEHNTKLAYVCRQLWQRYRSWSGFRVAASTFTTTPNIGPGKEAFKA
mmetsp:Transcript_45392/g.114895  ORF Transcript_45392/g.114895 Transcript_45392/m.114895 type:complete len:422 (-) Transcript_45392:118-1383(-)|eukprot:jgi/Tetstr1/430320/TSEL_020145.t1